MSTNNKVHLFRIFIWFVSKMVFNGKKSLNTNNNNKQTNNFKFKQNYLLVSYEMRVLNMV